MAGYADGGRKTFQAGEALLDYRLVKLGAAERDVVYADAADYNVMIGSTEEGCGDNEEVAIRLVNAPGTRILTANGAIDVNTHVIAAADGKVAPDGGGATEPVIGMALQAAANDGDQIEVMLFPAPRTMDLR